MSELPNLSLPALREAYLAGTLRPADLVARIRELVAATAHDNIWIHVLSDAELAPYLERLERADPASLPLYGVPFAIKDNIDLAGVPTTAACREYAYVPQRSAYVVERLLEAGAIPIGKTNLDQFATGLVGTRSPYGATRNAFDPEYISGGSSAGSAVSVAKAQVSFALGTDTAGSGRVPAAFNNLVGVKPTRGLLSTSGVVPACRTLDCVTVFALDVPDARAVIDVVTSYDRDDPYARPVQPGPAARQTFRFGVPDRLEFFGDSDAERLFGATVARLEALGGEAVSLPFDAFYEAARLLYEGPWVAERYAAIETFITAHEDALYPVTRDIIAPATAASAVSAFKAQYRLAALKRRADEAIRDVEFVVTPTAGTIYRIAEVERDPVRLNSKLGHYTNFMNLLDLAAIAVPAGFAASGLPFGVTLFGPAFADDALAAYAQRLHEALAAPLGACGRALVPSPLPDSGALARVTVCGAHMSGLALNHQLTDRGGRLLRATRTAPCYRLYALPGGPPYRPGLVRQSDGGDSIEVEVWEVPSQHVGSFLAGIPQPLGLGTVLLEDGSSETGFICEGFAAAGATDITALGSWRAYLASLGQ